MKEEYSRAKISNFYYLTEDLKKRLEIAQNKLSDNSPPLPTPDTDNPVPSFVPPSTDEKQTKIQDLEVQKATLEKKEKKRKQINTNNRIKQEKDKEIERLKKETSQNPSSNNNGKTAFFILAIILVVFCLLWLITSRKKKTKI
ncbi:MAG: hypothetical protein MRERC_5c090 [Mycoplasmataceae bacterium RC_NB112A]|nr:MAG: hypothetical protein MRERC_5c090 [Mycoplasmataceae bacterium RC_NB112A]